MKVCILDRQDKSRDQILKWLSEDKRIIQAEAFEDYIKFIEHVGDSPPDFCIIRLGTDGISGLKAAEIVRHISPNIRIVFISDDRDYALHAYEVGADGYLLCPVEHDKLEKCLHSDSPKERMNGGQI